MRFANVWLMLAVVTATTGCESINELLKPGKKADAPATKISAAGPASATASTTASAAMPATAAVAIVPVAPPEPPINPTALRTFEQANHAMKEGRIDDAERGFRAVMQSNPELGGPHANLGVMYRNANKLPEAVIELQQAVRVNPKQALYWNQLGVTYRQQGQFDKAREAYERAIALDANYANAILNLGILYDMYLGEDKRALDLYTRYLTLMPNDATVSKWVAELKNRKPAAQKAPQKEKE